jgi:hypothetical protein
MFAEKRYDPDSITRIPNVFVNCMFPQSDPGQVDHWQRTQNGVTMILHPYIDTTGVESGKYAARHGAPQTGQRKYPYGVFSRLLLYWVGWHAMFRAERKIMLAPIFPEFVKKFRIRARSRDRERLLDHMMRVFQCHIEFKIDTQYSKIWRYLPITEEGLVAFHDVNLPDAKLTDESHVTLSENFYKMLRHRPVPVDIRALQALRHSTLAIDLYTWGTYQTFSLQKAKQPRIYSWKQLAHQFGANYCYPSEFKEKIPRVLRQVHAVYPEFMVELLHEGLKVYPSRPAVLPEGKEEKIIEAN